MNHPRPSDPTINVIIVPDMITPIGMVTLMSVYKKDGTEIRESWDYLQNVKDEVFGSNVQAVEVYPKVSKVVNRMNIRHLWILPDDFEMPFTLGADFMTKATRKVQDKFDEIIVSHKRDVLNKY